MQINLATETKEQEILKAYLEENATEYLAEKINNGVQIEKNGKQLLSKKTLSGFMKYASDEARKLAEKGANCACVEDEVVFGWAMHYFEEDSIEGKLFNLDGTEYKPAPKKIPTSTTPPVVTTPKPKKSDTGQLSLFDSLTEEEVTTPVESVKTEFTPIAEPKKPSPMYQQYLDLQRKYPDCILFLRIGDFYEVFADSAVTASRELELTLTSRDCGLEKRVPMCGIPYHATDNYFKKLLDKGFKIAVAENSEEVEILPSEEEIEELTEEEMQQFYGDINEPIMDDEGEINNCPDLIILNKLLALFGKDIEVKQCKYQK